MMLEKLTQGFVHVDCISKAIVVVFVYFEHDFIAAQFVPGYVIRFPVHVILMVLVIISKLWIAFHALAKLTTRGLDCTIQPAVDILLTPCLHTVIGASTCAADDVEVLIPDLIEVEALQVELIRRIVVESGTVYSEHSGSSVFVKIVCVYIKSSYTPKDIAA
jgi:hypothetical protein